MGAPCNFDILPQDCTLETCCLDQATINYRPSIAGNLIYAAILGAILLSQIGFGIRYKTWGFLTGMFCGLVLEVLGYVGRLWIHAKPFDMNAFLMYLISLTIGPAFLSAAIYLCLARIVVAYGEHLSRFKPGTYNLIFVSCNLLALIFQAAGGAIASIADDTKTTWLDIHIMIVGLAFQVASSVMFMVLSVNFAMRVRKAPAACNPSFSNLTTSRKFKGLLFALALSTICIFIRSVYRVIELQSGFNGSVANDEASFMILEGPMIIIATAALTFYHPGFCFARRWTEASWSLRGNGHAPERIALKEMDS